jgi:hypothetical protein
MDVSKNYFTGVAVVDLRLRVANPLLWARFSAPTSCM